ncbi:MAG: hypothetical protein V1732_02370 [Patescibacteria group bacterium]
MDIKKCDHCKKTKSDKDNKEWASIHISGWNSGYRTFDFCGNCAKKFIGKIESIFGKKEKIKN